MLTLYSYYRSPCSYRVRIALAVKGLKYAYEPVHLVRNGGEQFTPEYKTVNPQSFVPVLLDGETKITQSLAILEYLEEKYPGPAPLLPEKPEARAYVRQVAQMAAVDIHPLTTLRVMNHLSGEFGVTQQQKNDWARKWMQNGLEAMEKIVEQSPHRTGPFVCGDRAGMADICLIPQLYDARRLDLPLDSFPTLCEIERNCLKLKTFSDACPENQPDTPDDQRPAFMKGKAS
ncbi:MAG: maleylacetoacetate isomerase [Alphaproteobacteria bacterium]|nr:maleylacetoacetate isomerase [Alphaproteobacteria bacterium]